ncbi:MAG: ribose 5-phosphate isomerase B [Bacteroidota bacterium]
MNNLPKIAIGSDHAGFDQKEFIKDFLSQKGYEVTDYGTFTNDSVDYPDYAHQVANSVLNTQDTLGILLCGSGNGVCLTANKHKGIRAALCWLPELGALARQHNNANILCLPARYVDNKMASDIAISYLTASFEGGRHERRVEKIDL